MGRESAEAHIGVPLAPLLLRICWQRDKRSSSDAIPTSSSGAVSQPGAVVIGGYATAVSALRSLAREGVRTAVILTDRNDIAHRSRYAHEFHRVRALDKSVDGLIDLLQEQGLRWRGWALIP